MLENIILLLLWVITFTFWQYILKFYIEKYNDYLEVKYRILNYTKLKAHKITNFRIDEEISKELRQLSCDLTSSYHILPKWIKIFKNEKEISDISSKLIWLSNCLWNNQNHNKDIIDLYKSIEKSLFNI